MSADAPLSGLLVVSLEQAVAAPYATSELAAAGARVIKIERSEGDFARGYDTAAGGESSYFVWLNQGKQSIALDIKAPADRDLLHRMIAAADIFVQNLAPGAAARAGFDSEVLRDRHPGLITCDISGYGPSPDLASKKAYDLLVQAESGLSAITGGAREMGRIGVSICDIGAGMTAHAAMLEALIARGRSGRGRGLHISLFDVAAHWMTVPLIHAEYGSGPPRREGLRHPSIAPYGVYACADGASTLISIQNEREWGRLCRDVLEAPEMAEDPDFADNTARVLHRDRLERAVADRVLRLEAPEFRRRLDTAAIAWGAVNTVPEVARHLALSCRRIRTSGGTALQVPARAQGGDPERRAPLIDEHGAALRREFAA